MDISELTLSSKQLKKLGKIQDELLQLWDSSSVYLETDIEDLDDLKPVGSIIESLNLESELYREMTLAELSDPDEIDEDYGLSEIEKLAKLQREREEYSDALMRLEDLRNFSLYSYEHMLLEEYSQVIDTYNLYNNHILEDLDDSPSLTVLAQRLEEQFLKDMNQLREQKQLEKERSRLLKYVEDFKTMLKAFSPGSSSAEATQVLIDVYKRMLSYL